MARRIFQGNPNTFDVAVLLVSWALQWGCGKVDEIVPPADAYSGNGDGGPTEGGDSGLDAGSDSREGAASSLHGCPAACDDQGVTTTCTSRTLHLCACRNVIYPQAPSNCRPAGALFTGSPYVTGYCCEP